MSVIRILVLSSIIAISLPASLAAQTDRQYDAHEHGVSKLQIAIDKNQMQFVLEAPGADIVGFERKAKTSGQKASVAQALELLRKPAEIFQLPPSARCSLSSATAELEFSGGGDTEAGHTEFHATYSFNCSSPGALKTIGIRFFELFANAKEIELEAISNFGQLAVEIPGGAREIDLSSIVE